LVRRPDLKSHQDGAKKDGLGQVAEVASADRDEGHRGEDCRPDLMFLAAGRDFQMASGAKADQPAEVQKLPDAQVQRRRDAAVAKLQGERAVQVDLARREPKQQAGLQMVA
jgi:hypothetical protein